MGQGLGSSTPKQVRHALQLMEREGYSTRIVEKRHEHLAPIIAGLGGSVERWLHAMSVTQISAVIDRLTEER